MRDGKEGAREKNKEVDVYIFTSIYFVDRACTFIFL